MIRQAMIKQSGIEMIKEIASDSLKLVCDSEKSATENYEILDSLFDLKHKVDSVIVYYEKENRNESK